MTSRRASLFAADGERARFIVNDELRIFEQLRTDQQVVLDDDDYWFNLAEPFNLRGGLGGGRLLIPVHP